MYAVTGITGKVGAAVARSLLSADQPVRAVVRDRGKGALWADLGCDIAVADLVAAAKTHLRELLLKFDVAIEQEGRLQIIKDGVSEFSHAS